MNYYVLSDVHNCFDEMMAALNKAGFNKSDPNHKIIFLGDAFDKGNQPVETYLFFKELIEKDKMIWILGNHDVKVINSIKNQAYKDVSTEIEIAKYYDKSITDASDFNQVRKVLIEHGVLDLLENKTCDYFELNNYIFTHGFIPTRKGKYDPNWRNTSTSNWKSRTTNGVKKILIEGIEIPGKTLVCGHVGAYFGHLIDKHPNIDVKSDEFNRLKKEYQSDYSKYQTFISDKVINLDANGYKTGYINVLIIKE